MTVKEYIETFALEHDHPYANAALLKWINLVESNLDIIPSFTVKYYVRALNAFQYALPAGVDIEDISKVRVNVDKYKKKDCREYKNRNSFWLEDNKLCIYPACPENDLSYVSEENEITFAATTITTTGVDFTFSIGDTILISGCVANTVNNKYATIIGVAAKVSTFAEGTFIAGAEVAAITIARPKIRVVYENKPAVKLIANYETDILNLPDRWIEIYDFFIMSKISYLQREYREYGNHMVSFNNKVAEYKAWYGDHSPQSPQDEIEAEIDSGYSRRNDFDRS